MADRNPANQCEKMKIHEKYSIEGYKDLSSWNAQDAQAVLSFDKIFIPVIITGLAASLGKYPTTYPYAYVGGWLLLTYWIFLSWRYRTRQVQRFHIMKVTELCLGFSAGRLLKDRDWPPRDIHLRWGFYYVVVIVAASAGAVPLHPCVPPLLSRWLWWVLPFLSLILGLVSLILWCVTKKLAKKEAKQDSK